VAHRSALTGATHLAQIILAQIIKARRKQGAGFNAMPAISIQRIHSSAMEFLAG
jgi:hypothetical protein